MNSPNASARLRNCLIEQTSEQSTQQLVNKEKLVRFVKDREVPTQSLAMATAM